MSVLRTEFRVVGEDAIYEKPNLPGICDNCVLGPLFPVSVARLLRLPYFC